MLDVPQEYGVAGLDLLNPGVIQEEVSRTVALPFRANPLFGPDVRPILFYCNDEQKRRFLYPVIEGKLSVRFARTEPDAVAIPPVCGRPRCSTLAHGAASDSQSQVLALETRPPESLDGG